MTDDTNFNMSDIIPDIQLFSFVSFGIFFPDKYNMDYAYPINGFIIPILAVIILVTNVIFIIVFIKGRMNTSTHVFLRFMAICDILTVVVPTPCFVYMFMLGNYKDFIPYDLCVIWDHFTLYIPTITHTASIWLTVGLAIQRFMCVCFPFSVKLWCRGKHAYISIVIIFIAAIVCHISLFLEKEIGKVPVRSKLDPEITFYGCIPKNRKWVTDSGMQYFIVYYWCRALAMQIIPCVLMALFNGIIIGKIRQAERKRQKLRNQNTGTTHDREHKATTWLVIVIVNSVLVVELPVGVFLVLYAYMITSGDSIIPLTVIQPVEMILNLLVLVSYPLHFVLYSCMSSSFRNTLTRVLKPPDICRRRKSRDMHDVHTNSLTEISHF